MANLSNLITQTVGSSSGGVNLITAPSQSSIWTATGLTLSTTTTAAELPLAGFSNTAVKFALTGSTTSAYVDFDVPTALLNTKLALQWYARASVTTIGNITLTLQSYASSANRTSNTSPTSVTLQTSSVQSAAQSFQTTFDAASQQFFRLTLSFPAASGQWYSLAQMVVGPGAVVQGAAISEWQAYTPTLTNITIGNGTVSGRYRRVGSNIEGNINVVSGTTTTYSSSDWEFSIPSGLNYLEPGNSTVETVVGTAIGQINDGSDSEQRNGFATFIAGTTTRFKVKRADALANATANFWNSTTTGAGNNLNFTRLSIWFSFPVSEWAGSGTISLGPGAQVEFAWNSTSTATAGTYTSNKGYGPQGTPILNYSPAGLNIAAYECDFQYAIQSDDVITLEVDDGTSGARWSNYVTRLGSYTQNDAGTTAYGAQVQIVGTNTVRVNFFSAIAPASAWSALTGVPTWRWRVRKAKASSPVGFGLASSTESGLVNPYNTSNGVVYAGTYTATLTNGANVAASTFVGANYMRIGNQVQVSFLINVQTTAAANSLTLLEMSLPIASNLTASQDLSGSGVRTGAAVTSSQAIIYGSPGNDRAIIEFNSQSTSNLTLCGQFMYTLK